MNHTKSLTILFAFSLAAFLGAPSASSQAGLLAPANVCKGQKVIPKTQSERNNAKRTMRCLHNYARKKKGKRKLKMNPSLGRSSFYKAGDIVKCKQYSHYACGRRWDYWINKLYTKSALGVGENIHWGTPGNNTIRQIMKDWLNSPGHRSTIVNSTVRNVGFHVRYTRKMPGWNNSWIWVAHFGIG